MSTGEMLKKLPHPPVSALAALSVVALWGCLLIYTSRALGESPMYFAGRQLVWLCAGAGVFLLAGAMPFRFWRKAALYLFFCSAVLLAIVLFWGKRVNGMSGWFELGGWITVQPSEFAKGMLLLYLSTLAAKDGDAPEWKTFLRMLIPSLICCALVLLEPDFGSAFLMFCGFLIVCFTAGKPVRYLAGTVLLCAGAAAVFLRRHPYALKRVFDFLSGGEGAWHAANFKFALGRGGLIGSGDGAALWSNGYLPFPHTDSLYATIVESSGLVGGLIVLTLFVLFGLLFVRMSKKPGLPADASVYICSIGMLYLTQALLHMGVNTVLLPTTGVTLPVLSYGGSSLVSTFLALGAAFSAERSAPVQPGRTSA